MRRKKSQEKRIAHDRIRTLFEMAEKEAMKKNWARAGRYVDLARTIGMRYNVTPGASLRRRFCRGCGVFLLPSVTARVRVGDSRVNYTCLKCARVSRFPYRREAKNRRKSKLRRQGGPKAAMEKTRLQD